MKSLARYFGKGLLFIAPIGLTLYVLWFILYHIDHLIRDTLGLDGFGPWVTVLGIVMLLAAVVLTGMLMSLFITRPLFQLVERVFGHLPLVKLVYASLKDLIGAFVGDKKKFDKPVLVHIIPHSNIRALGFVTRQSLQREDMSDDIAVYLPQSYNFAGNVLIIPRKQVVPLDVESSELMAFIVSGGVTGMLSDAEKDEDDSEV